MLQELWSSSQMFCEHSQSSEISSSCSVNGTWKHAQVLSSNCLLSIASHVALNACFHVKIAAGIKSEGGGFRQIALDDGLGLQRHTAICALPPYKVHSLDYYNFERDCPKNSPSATAHTWHTAPISEVRFSLASGLS